MTMLFDLAKLNFIVHKVCFVLYFSVESAEVIKPDGSLVVYPVSIIQYC